MPSFFLLDNAKAKNNAKKNLKRVGVSILMFSIKFQL